MRVKYLMVPWLGLLAMVGGCMRPEAAPPWKFAFFCDGRSDKKNDPGATNGVRWASIRAMAEDVARKQVDLVVFPGDLANGGTNFGTLTQQWTAWTNDMGALYSAGIGVFPVRGNHELHQPDSIETWRRIFSYLPQNGPPGQEGLTFKVEHKNACFIGIDQFVGQPGGIAEPKGPNPKMTNMVSPWVMEQIRQTPKKWVFAYGHESAFFGHHKDSLASDEKSRDDLWNALGERGGVYLSGHDHMYIRHWAPDKDNHPVLELVDGCGGAPNYAYDNVAMNAKPATDLFINAAKPTVNTKGYPAYFGYVLITVYPDHLEGEWWALTNYDTTRVATEPPPNPPKFEKLDSFTWPAGQGGAATP